MNISEIFSLISSNLIPLMVSMLILCLIFRFLVYKSGKIDSRYFTNFSRLIEKKLETHLKAENTIDIEKWMNQLLSSVVAELPDRTLRSDKKEKKPENSDENSFRYQDKETFEDFVEGRKSIIHSVRQQMDAFSSSHPPHFPDLTRKILQQDRRWTSLFGIFSIDKLSRIMDILPGLFIVCGIFGTFLGITAALPIISKIDLSNIDQAAPLLNSFVASVAFSMNTSLVGIICSVTMTVLNALFPITEVRSKVSKTLEFCFQLVWYKLHGEKLSQGEALIVEQLKKLNQNFKLSPPKKPNLKKSA